MLNRKIQSMGYALSGLRTAWREEWNFRTEIAFALATLALAAYFNISASEWVVVIFMIGFVLSAEALNTALEEFCDMVKTDPDPHIAKIKDLAAAGVFLAATTSFVIGCIIFLPRIVDLFA